MQDTVLRTITTPIVIKMLTVNCVPILIHIIEEDWIHTHTLSPLELAITDPTAQQSLKRILEHLERQATGKNPPTAPHLHERL